ncbi:MAG TPA: hypothetical protein VFO39_01360 [Candidatus Sulfotelmatobacter sp.]|nr:hypothetical protein [Candidatus Sulfotelmatobacter sp.]
MLAQGNVFIKELLRSRGIRIGTTKADFEENMIRAIQSGELQRVHVDWWLKEVEGWGDQHIYLFNVSKSVRDDPMWSNPKTIESKIKAAGFAKEWGSRSSLEYPSAQTLTGVHFEDGALTFVWHKGLDLWVRAKAKDHKEEEEGDIYEYRAYRMRGDRIVTRFQLRPTDGLAAIFVQIAVDDEEHKTAVETVKRTVERCWSFDEFTPTSIANAIKKLDNEALNSESITAQSTRLNSGAAYVEFGASSARSGYVDSTAVRDVRRSVRQGSFTGTNGRYIVPVATEEQAGRRVRVQMYGRERRIKIASQMTAEQVWSVLGLVTS